MHNVFIFDCFGVVISEISELWFGKHLSSEQAMDIENTFAKQVNVGEISADEFYRELSAMSGRLPNQIRNEWMALAEVNQGVVDLIKRCHSLGRTALLSNAFNPLLRDLLRMNDLEKYFDKIFISCEIGMQKPDPKMFVFALEQLQTSAAQSIFVDDRIENVEAAKKFGIDGILYDGSAKNLEHELVKRGML